MFNDANSDPRLPCRLVDRNRVTVNPETGNVMEVGGYVVLDPVITIGKMPDKLKQTINKNIESDRIQDLLYKDRLSPVDPIGELVVESAAIGKLLELAGKAALYGIGRYGGKFGLNKLQGLARQKLLEKEFALSNADNWQNVIDFENHIRNSLKYLPAVTPFAIGAKSNDYNSGKDIHIKPSKRGTFTKAAKQRGMSVQGFANRVLRNPSKYSAAMRKKANFARNASKWNK